MEGKNVIVSVLIMSLVIAQSLVEAKICCPNLNSRYIFIASRHQPTPVPVCVAISGCRNIAGDCPRDFPYDINFGNSGGALNEYCNIGCEFSVCGALTTLQNSDASDIVSEAVKNCATACSTLCNKDSRTQVKAA